MSQPLMRRSTGSALLLVIPVLFVTACGDDATDACDRVVDGFARAWQRCGKDYAMAKATFGDAFKCSDAKDYDEDKVNQCVGALDSLSCSSVMNGVSPGACNSGALMR